MSKKEWILNPGIETLNQEQLQLIDEIIQTLIVQTDDIDPAYWKDFDCPEAALVRETAVKAGFMWRCSNKVPHPDDFEKPDITCDWENSLLDTSCLGCTAKRPAPEEV